MNSKTLIFITKRLLLGLLTIFVVITITFWAMRAIPGGPFESEKALDPEVMQKLKELYGLDRPLIEQYFRYLGNALIFNFGYSIKSRGSVLVMDKIWDGLSTSAVVGLIAATLAIIIGLICGTIAAYRHNKASDRIIMICSTASVAMPSFVISSILLLLFCEIWKVLPANGETAAGYILPTITLSLAPMAYITRLTRSSTLDVINSDYIRTATAKGLSKNKVLFKHSARNSITPVITYAGPMIAYIITGSLVVEQIFGIPGLGRTFVSCITNRDYPVIMGTTIFLTYLMVILVLLSDILYKIVNPRIELD